jgi:hypothetical protein
MATFHDDDRFAPAHVVEVFYDEASYAEASYDRHAQRWRAECSCGWTGDWHDDAALADADGDGHREVAVGPGDGLDRLMGELLDLQDDLARVVIWLAEHWSADLPVPDAYGTGVGRVEVRMNAYCHSAELLSRAASLLGVPLVDDPATNSQGVRYRRAVRRFGRVSLQAYRALAPICDECGTVLADGEQCPVCGERRDARPVTLGAA